MSYPIPDREEYTLPPSEFETLRTAALDFTRTYMSRFDPSHDFNHIQRVVSLASVMAASYTPTARALDTNLLTLAAILHDIGDHKYTSATAPDPTPVSTFLLSLSPPCPAALAAAVQCVVSHVSFSHESKHPAVVQSVLKIYPELACVQDADRLDAIGAVGVARAFVFGGVKQPERGLGGSIDHFGEKLLKLGSMMKTEKGKEMARERTRRLEVFEEWFREEVGVVVKENVIF